MVRDIEFLAAMQVSILSERRVLRPYGLDGGGDGECGQNLWITFDEDLGERRALNIGSKNTVLVQPHDQIIIRTPGGGGWSNSVD